MGELLNLMRKTVTAETFAVDGRSATVLDVSGLQTLAIQVALANVTPTNKTFADTDVNTTNDTATISAHGFTTGLAITLTTTGSLPAGLSLATTYYVIRVDANTIKFATSAANAVAGTAINLTTQGGAGSTNTVNVTALSATLNVDGSVDGTTWFELASDQSVGSETSFLFSLTNPTVKYVALQVDITSGVVTVAQEIIGKGLV